MFPKTVSLVLSIIIHDEATMNVLDFRISSFGSVSLSLSLSDCYLSEMLYMNEIIAQFSVPDNCKRVTFENQRITKSVT